MMNDKRLTILIDVREVLPVRAIPHVTKWIRFTPDKVAQYFARDERALGIARGRVLIDAYHLSGTELVPVMPREWDAVVASLEGFGAETWTQHGKDELGEKIGYAAWRSGSVAKLPEGVFVWLDEFEKVFLADVECTGSYKEQPGDDKLTLAPMLDAATRAMVMEGFDMPKAQAEQAAKQAVPVSTKQQRQDALAVELDTILCAMEKPTPAKVMAKLRDQIGKPNTCITANVGDGLQWERDNGNVETLSIAALGERIKSWRGKTKAKPRLTQG